MISIQNNTDENFTCVRAIANEVWPIAYGTIISQEQLHYMMEMMYSIPSLQNQAKEKKHRFILAKEGETVLGFASYEFNYTKKPKNKNSQNLCFVQSTRERHRETTRSIYY